MPSDDLDGGDASERREADHPRGLRYRGRTYGGAQVYGGSDPVVRGDFEALHARDPRGCPACGGTGAHIRCRRDGVLLGTVRVAVKLRRHAGCDAAGRRCPGVLEQSWRVGGGSGAEVAALEAFRADPGLRAVRASTVEIYGQHHAPPPGAVVYFRGGDERVGLMTRYAVARPHGGP